MRVVALAFEIQHGVHHVLERLRTGETAVLGDVADEERRDVVALRGKQKLRGGFAHLPDAAGRRLELQREHRLDRVHDHQRRLHAADFLEDALDAGLREQVQRRIANTQPIAARLDLMLRLLTRRVQHRPDGVARSSPPLAVTRWTCRCRARRQATPAIPGTMPPPSTRSNSLMPVVMRSAFDASISEYFFAPGVAIPGIA